MNNMYIGITMLVLVVAILSSLAVFAGYLPHLIRMYNFKKLAKTYGLDVVNCKNIFLARPERYASNILKGSFNGHNIEVSDIISSADTLHTWAKRETLILIDGEQKNISGLVTGHASIAKIKEILDNLA